MLNRKKKLVRLAAKAFQFWCLLAFKQMMSFALINVHLEKENADTKMTLAISEFASSPIDNSNQTHGGQSINTCKLREKEMQQLTELEIRRQWLTGNEEKKVD